jgi:SSS family solute:Na+ symporter
MRKLASSLEGAFLAGRKVPGFLASLSTVATNLNVNDFIGGAGFIYLVGVVLAHIGMINGLALILVSLFLVQKLRRLNVFTLGGWLEKRYCATVGIMYSITWSVIWMLFNLGLYIYGGALVLNTLVGWNLYISIVLLSIIAAVYTLIGGLRAVIATDVLQISLMFFPFLFLALVVWIDVGGPAGLAASLPEAKAVFWTNDTPFGSLAVMFLGIFFMSVSYWSCEAQVIQRPLSARSEEDSTISYLGASIWFILLCPLLISIPALATIKYFPNLENPDLAMPSLVQKFLPHGLYGVMVVGLVAGFFSSADSQINAFCAMFTSDIYKRLLRPGKNESHYLRASKVAGVIFTLAAIGTALLVSRAEKGMFLFAISIVATIMPPFGAITVIGALSRRVNRTGALIGLIGGILVAIGLVVASGMGYLSSIAGNNTLYFRTMVTFLVTSLLTYLGSLFSTGYRYDGSPVEVDITTRLSRRVIRLVILMLVAMLGMCAFWTYYFH